MKDIEEVEGDKNVSFGGLGAVMGGVQLKCDFLETFGEALNGKGYGMLLGRVSGVEP